MATRAFLLCGDEKAVQAVTQILDELEVSFEHSSEPAFSLKRLTTQRFDLLVVDGAVTLDDTRFRADHAYRVELRRGTAVIGGALIYLSPPRRGRGHVSFDDADATRDDDRGELRPSDKGAL